MTNVQLYLAIGVPILFNTLVAVTLFVGATARVSSLDQRMTDGFAALNQRINDMNLRLDDLRDLWRAELRRVEEGREMRRERHEERPRP
jgi:hypothetical protein